MRFKEHYLRLFWRCSQQFGGQRRKFHGPGSRVHLKIHNLATFCAQNSDKRRSYLLLPLTPQFVSLVDLSVKRRAMDWLCAVGNEEHGDKIRFFDQAIHSGQDTVQSTQFFVLLVVEKGEHQIGNSPPGFGRPLLQRETSSVKVPVKRPEANRIARPQLTFHA